MKRKKEAQTISGLVLTLCISLAEFLLGKGFTMSLS